MHGVFLNDLGAIMAANEVLTCHYQRYVNVPFSIYFIAVVIAMPENYPYDLQFQKKLHIFFSNYKPNRFWKRNFSSIRPSKMPQDMSPGAFLF